MRIVLSLCLIVACATWLSAENWPQWRGPDRTDVSQETGLLKEWPKDGPQRLWLFEDAGLGYSSFSIANGKLFTMGAREDTEFLICLDANTGTELWSRRIGSRLVDNRGDGPRGTPSVDGDMVFAMGGQGTLVGVAVENGEVRWHKTMSTLGGKKPGWGYCESVLIDGPRVICTPGGADGAIVSLNKSDGELIWQATDVSDRAAYSSIIPTELNGQRQYVQLFMNSLVGVAADSGKLLWKTDWPGKTAVVPTPIVHDGHIYITSGYGVGCKLVKIGAENKVEEVYFSQAMKNHHGGVLLVGEHLYGYSDNVGWICQDFKTGEIVWAEKSALGKGCLTCADGRLYCLDERTGEVVLAGASPNGWKEHGRFHPDAKTTKRSPKGQIWTHPVVCNGKLYLRDQELLSCYDVSAK